MLNEILFVQQALNDHLFFLRTIKEFCLNIQLSFFQNEQQYIQTAEEFSKRGDELLRQAFQLSNGKVFESALVNRIFVTQFTLPCEELTQQLFDIKIDTTLTKEQLELKAGEKIEITEELIAQIDELNKSALRFTENFIDFANHIYQALKANEDFSYSYPSLFVYMIEEAELYQKDLIRLINRSGVDPIFIVDFGYYFSKSLQLANRFIRGLSDPSQFDVIQRASFFENEFGKFMTDYQVAGLNPDAQKDIMDREIKIVSDYQQFLEEIITNILNANLYFIVEPVFFDNLYTEANYFMYLLKGAEFGQAKNTSM